MALRRRHILGLVVEEHSVLVAEVALGGRRRALVRAAELPLAVPAGASDAEAQEVGRDLRSLLRAEGFRAREAVIAVPASWLLAARKSFPPAGTATFGSMARIEAERSFATDIADLIVDCTANSTTEQARQALLVALPRRAVELLRATALAAGLRVRAITSTALALAGAPGLAGARILLVLTPQRAEVVTRSGDRVTDVRHTGLPPAAPEPIAGEPGAGWLRAVGSLLARVVALSPTPESEGGDEVVVWDSIGLGARVIAAVGESAGLRVRRSSGLAEMGIAGPSDHLAAPGPAVAAVVALVGARRGGLPVDFLRPSLEIRRRSRRWPRIAWAAATCLAVLGAVLSLSAQWRADRQEVVQLQERLRQMQPEIRVAEAMADQTRLARRWTARSPRLLNVLRDLTLLFPEQGQIWATSVVVREDLHVLISGKSDREQPVLVLLERIQGRPEFANAQLLYLRQAGTERRELAFALACDYMQGETP